MLCWSFVKISLAAELQTLETEGQMFQRVMPDLMGMKHVLAVVNENGELIPHGCLTNEGRETYNELGASAFS